MGESEVLGHLDPYNNLVKTVKESLWGTESEALGIWEKWRGLLHKRSGCFGL